MSRLLLVCKLLLVFGEKGGASQPNILLMVADDLGYNDVPWHNTKVIAPNLMNLAKSGVILEQHYAQPSCSPTRSALLTGRYPFRTGMNIGPIHPNVPFGLPTEFSTLADDLKLAGYSTQVVGKWHLGFCNAKYLPTNRGFDSHFGYWNGAEDYFSHRRVGKYDMHHNFEIARNTSGTYSTKLFQEKAKEIISKHNKSKPLFLYLPFQSVHGPLQVPHHYKKLQNKEVKNKDRRTFLGMITAMDDAIGNVTEAFKNANMLENTIIIFLSDNGGDPKYGGNNDPLRGGKFRVWEGGTRSVALIKGPGIKPRVENRMMHVVDWYPTLIQAVSNANFNASQTPTYEKEMDGLNLWRPLRTGIGKWERTEIVYNIRPRRDETIWRGGATPQVAIRMGDWKFIEIEKDRYGKMIHNHLYNLRQDPKEKDNVASKYPKQVNKMKFRLKEVGSKMYNATYLPLFQPHFHSGATETGWC